MPSPTQSSHCESTRRLDLAHKWNLTLPPSAIHHSLTKIDAPRRTDGGGGVDVRNATTEQKAPGQVPRKPLFLKWMEPR
ncbi:hypothetical protein FA13DRAFT_1731586 [Coprinellus micaceus]|uniref:Uncharacterized protein n=1 Tax=Coprinellus micaceus TaxID=71717 RepID=A0A4Y7TEK6_COPMI|nr:hypothetical protein FA13DRAFT_1731586 [Coprinellus micaceus]